MKGHTYVSWYQQLPEGGLKFLITLRREQIIDESGMPSKRFSARFPKEGPGVFNIQLAEPGDSTVYFCASSTSTPIQSHILPEHKPPPGPAPTQPQLGEGPGPQLGEGPPSPCSITQTLSCAEGDIISEVKYWLTKHFTFLYFIVYFKSSLHALSTEFY